jgi:hypothetical protein
MALAGLLKRRSTMKRLCPYTPMAVLILATLGLASCSTVQRLTGMKSQATEERAVSASGFAAAAQKVGAAVVRVIGEAKPEAVLLQAAESTVTADKTYSVGSGFFISTEGRIVTANHVVAPVVGELMVETRYTGRITRHRATVLFQDPNADVAVLQIDGTGYPAVDLANPASPPVGEAVGFAGYPTSLMFPIISKGIIAAKANMSLHQELQARNWVVLNVPVSPGCSGGPLFLETTGQVIGVVNAQKSGDAADRKVVLPPDYSPTTQVGGVDPVRLAVETYNNNLELVGDASQLSIGLAASAEYLMTRPQPAVMSAPQPPRAAVPQPTVMTTPQSPATTAPQTGAVQVPQLRKQTPSGKREADTGKWVTPSGKQ